MESPAEYSVRRITPSLTLPREAAIARTVVRIGPMQGVHPSANAKPRRKPLTMPGLFPPTSLIWTSRFNHRDIGGPKRKMSDAA